MIEIIAALIIGFVCGMVCGWNAGIEWVAKAMRDHIERFYKEKMNK